MFFYFMLFKLCFVIIREEKLFMLDLNCWRLIDMLFFFDFFFVGGGGNFVFYLVSYELYCFICNY